MDKSLIQKQLQYIFAKEQYLKPLFENGLISEEVSDEILKNLYDDFEVWRCNKIKNPSIKINRQKRKINNDLSEQNPGYVSLTELAKRKSKKSTGYTIQTWLRDSKTIDFLTLWETKYNDKFLPIAMTARTFTPKIWIKETNAIGIVSRQGKNGGTYADKKIAMHFMCWLSADMMLNVIDKYLEEMSDEENN